jgi:hypothetical protein
MGTGDTLVEHGNNAFRKENFLIRNDLFWREIHPRDAASERSNRDNTGRR